MFFPSFPVRYQVTLLAFLGWVINFYMRANLSIAIVDMSTARTKVIGNITLYEQAEFTWTPKEKTFILSSFNYGYLWAPVGGIVATKYGGATVYGFGLFLTALLTLLTPLLCKLNFWIFIAARVLEGIFEASSAASCSLLFANWAPPKERSTLIATSISGGMLGAALNYPISGYVAKRFGWECVFYVSGVTALIWYLFWLLYSSNNPSTHKKITSEERKYLEKEIHNSINRTEKLNIPWKKMFTSRTFVTFIAHRFCMSWSFAFLIICVPLYIKGSTDLDVYNVGLLSGLTSIFTAILLPGAALIFDYIRTKRSISLTNIYKSYHLVGYLGQCIILMFMGSFRDSVAIIVGLTSCRFMALWTDCTIYTLPVDINPKYSAIIAGFGTSVFSIGGILSPMALGFIVYDLKNLDLWNRYFLVLAAVNFIGALIFTIFGSAKHEKWDDDTKSVGSNPNQTE